MADLITVSAGVFVVVILILKWVRETDTILLFVYGNLTSSGKDRDILKMAQAEFVNTGTLKGYRVLDKAFVGTYPGMVETDDPNSLVEGEVYKVVRHRIARVDAFMSDGYKRNLAILADTNTVVETYLLNR